MLCSIVVLFRLGLAPRPFLSGCFYEAELVYICYLERICGRKPVKPEKINIPPLFTEKKTRHILFTVGIFQTCELAARPGKVRRGVPLSGGLKMQIGRTENAEKKATAILFCKTMKKMQLTRDKKGPRQKKAVQNGSKVVAVSCKK